MLRILLVGRCYGETLPTGTLAVNLFAGYAAAKLPGGV
jgi:fluoride ion exporter CrcB/FEX